MIHQQNPNRLKNSNFQIRKTLKRLTQLNPEDLLSKNFKNISLSKTFCTLDLKAETEHTSIDSLQKTYCGQGSLAYSLRTQKGLKKSEQDSSSSSANSQIKKKNSKSLNSTIHFAGQKQNKVRKDILAYEELKQYQLFSIRNAKNIHSNKNGKCETTQCSESQAQDTHPNGFKKYSTIQGGRVFARRSPSKVNQDIGKRVKRSPSKSPNKKMHRARQMRNLSSVQRAAHLNEGPDMPNASTGIIKLQKLPSIQISPWDSIDEEMF